MHEGQSRLHVMQLDGGVARAVTGTDGHVLMYGATGSVSAMVNADLAAAEDSAVVQ